MSLSQEEEYNKFCAGEDYSFPTCDICKEAKFIDGVGMTMLNKWIREEHLACVCDTCLVPIEVIYKYKQELMRSDIPLKMASKAGAAGLTKMFTLMQLETMLLILKGVKMRYNIKPVPAPRQF